MCEREPSDQLLAPSSYALGLHLRARPEVQDDGIFVHTKRGARRRASVGRADPDRDVRSAPDATTHDGDDFAAVSVAERVGTERPERRRELRDVQEPRVRFHSGSTTASMTWMTPFEAAMSAFTTLAPFTVNPWPLDASLSSLPFTVFAVESFDASVEPTLPETTW